MSDKLAKTIARFQQRIDNKDFYEAHQTLRTITNRYVKARQYDAAITILHQGASVLAANREYASASDLVSYLLSVYTDAGVTCASSPDHRARLMSLIALLPDTEPSLGDVAKQAVAWSQADGASKFGDPALHHLAGSKLVAAVASQASDDDRYKLFAVAELHLILGTHESVPVYTDFLFSWYAQNRPAAPAGVFAARAVLNYAYLHNVKFARAALERFMEQYLATGARHESVDGLAHVDDELLNFLQLLVVTLGKDQAGEKFMTLYGHHKALLQQHELVAQVEYLGREYFSLPLGNAGGNNNMLANLMGGLFK